MAKTPSSKPVTRRAPAARTKSAVKAPVSKGTKKPVEWPVEAVKAKPKPETVALPAKTETVPAPIPTPPVVRKPKAAARTVAQLVAKPVERIQEAIEPSQDPIIPEPPIAADEKLKGNSIMTDAMETAKTYAEEAKTRMQSAYAEMNEKAKSAMEKSAKAMEEIGELTKGNFEAMVESSKIAAKGMETLSQEAVEYSRKSFEKSTSTFKSFAAIKSPSEFFQLQSELLSATMDSFASEAAKSSETMLKLAGDVTQPISNRVAIVTEKVKALAA